MPDLPQHAGSGSAGPDPAEQAGRRPVRQPRPPDSDVPTDSLPAVPAADDPAADNDTARAPAGAEQPPAGSGVRRVAALQSRAAWRAWRRSRPFWAGVLLILAGAEMLLIPLPMHSMGLIMHIGTGGVLGILIGVLLIVCALLIWFSPAQRTFYSIVAVLVAIAALIATNLGGFIIGTVLGIVGGSLAFAWMPAEPGEEPAARRRWGWGRGPARHGESSAGLPLVLGRSRAGGPADPADDSSADDSSADDSSRPDDGPQEDGAAAPAQRAYAGRRRSGAARYAGTDTYWSGRGSRDGSIYRGIPLIPVVLGVILGVLHPAASAHHHHPHACASPSATASAQPHASTTPQPTTSPSPSASPTACPSPSPTGSGAAGRADPKAKASPSPGTSGSPDPSGSPDASRRATVSGSLEVGAVPSSITANSATLTGLSYDGVAKVKTATGSVPMLKFSMSSLVLAGNDALTVNELGHVVTIRATTLNFTRDVTLLVTKISGDLLGIPLTFTPQSPPPLVLPKMVFTNVVTSQPYTSSGALTIDGLLITAR